jgi:hypothetical protein
VQQKGHLVWNARTQNVLPIPREENFRGRSRVIEVHPEWDSRYEQYVVAHPEALIYHHPAWLQVLERENGGRPVCLACEEADGSFSGVLSLFFTRGLPFSSNRRTDRRFSSLPRTPVSGPLTSTPQAAVALLAAALERTDVDEGVRLQIKVGSDALDGLIDGLAGAPWRPFYVLDLPANPDDLRFGSSHNHARIRATVKKGETLAIRLRQADCEKDLRTWYDLYLETMRWHANPPRPYRFFKAAWEVLNERGFFRLLLAERHEGRRVRLLAGSIFFTFGETYLYAFSGCRRDDLSLHPNDLIQWQAIHDACRQGFRYYDLGEVPEHHTGLAFFKKKWGAREKWLYRYYYPAPQRFEGSVLERLERNNAMKAIWRLLPLATTQLLGNWIYRCL